MVGEIFKGERITLNEIEGKEVTLVDFRFVPSNFRQNMEASILQLEVDGELKVVRTEAMVVLDICHRLKKTDLPSPVTFNKVKSAKGQTYWTVK